MTTVVIATICCRASTLKSISVLSYLSGQPEMPPRRRLGRRNFPACAERAIPSDVAVPDSEPHRPTSLSIIAAETTTVLSFSLRPARKADAPILAQLDNLASDGIAGYVWSLLAEPGEAPLDYGRRRLEREDSAFSYRNAVVAEADGQVVGMLLGYRQPDPYETGRPADLPNILNPLIALEAMVPGAWYVSSLAVLPDSRGRGVGARLLANADGLAQDSGARTASLIVAEANGRALGLYRRHGYERTARRPIVPYPGAQYDGDWVLLTKAVPSDDGPMPAAASP